MKITMLHDVSLDEIGNIFTRFVMEGIASPNVSEVARRAGGTISSVYQFVKLNFLYVPDPEGMELFYHPNRVCEDYLRGKTRILDSFDCDDQCLLNTALLGSLGYSVAAIIVDTTGDGDINHALTQVYSEPLGEWIDFDTTIEEPLGWRHKYREVIRVER